MPFKKGINAVKPTLTRFKEDEDGSFTVLSLFIFLGILMVGGMAVDITRLELERTKLQNTIDNAVLAAADLDQSLDTEAVLLSHITTAGFDATDVDIDIQKDSLLNGEVMGKTITARSRIDMQTAFMNMIGIDELRAPVRSGAIETIQNVEISLVLDISGSMRWDKNGNENSDNRITDLKDAVENFINTVMQVECDVNGNNCVQPTNTSSTTINIIPYAGHVNPGPELFDIMGGARWHPFSSCKEITSADFDDADLPDATADQLPHFMEWTINWDWMAWGWCPKDNAGILVAENDAQVMKDYVKNLKLHDGTATHVGMKYGLALLNPTSRDAFQTLNDRGVIADVYKNRPADFDDDVVKYVVLMTDGKITDQKRPNAVNYSTVYNPEASGHESLMDEWADVNGGGNPTGNTSDIEDRYPNTSNYNDGGKVHNKTRNVEHFLDMCASAKEPVYAMNGDGDILTIEGEPVIAKEDRVTVFTIAFLAPSEAQTQMKTCASSESHYFNVQDLTIDNAFSAIAKTINQLRLTQ
ncbi:MAG: hypothetical protein HKN02_09175 [Rhodobacteraceae bacterium]|nr:hypothetical protein [Paracoccaceae bacterium]